MRRSEWRHTRPALRGAAADSQTAGDAGDVAAVRETHVTFNAHRGLLLRPAVAHSHGGLKAYVMPHVLNMTVGFLLRCVFIAQAQQLAAVTTAEETGVPGLALYPDFVSETEEQVCRGSIF